MIESYQELYEAGRIKTEHLLIGNGFSIGIWKDFNYSSLYENQKVFLEIKDKMLFEELRTTNFEFVLENLKRANSINQIFHYQTIELQQSYERIKQALIRSVINVHPANYEIQLNNDIESNGTFRIFQKSIFTTNYDLIPYWLHIKQRNHNRVINDFFRNNGKQYLNFLPERYENNCLNLYYLHGGLHLFVNEKNLIQKVKKGSHHYLIDAVTESMADNNIPLYVSEGNWEDKLAQIESNKYLRFCYDALKRAEGHLTIFGHELSESADKHIVDAINLSKIDVIAYGIYDLDRKEAISERIRGYFPDKDIHFFNSRNFNDSIYNINNPLIWGHRPGQRLK
jgi:glycerophosphoryl diester phosphodiesterase